MPDSNCADALLSVFDRIYVLNLAHRTDRRREIAADLGRIGLSLDHPAVELFAAIAPADPGPFPTKGARGCFESHLAMHRAIVAAGVPRALILEDDASFIRTFAQDFRTVLPLLQTVDWDFLYSVQDITTGPDDTPLGRGLVRLSPANTFTTTHFLGVTQRFSRAAIPFLETMLARPPGDPAGGPMHVDGAYGWMRAAHPELPVIATQQTLAVQRSSRSDIADLRLFDRLPVVRDLVAALRRLRARG